MVFHNAWIMHGHHGFHSGQSKFWKCLKIMGKKNNLKSIGPWQPWIMVSPWWNPIGPCVEINPEVWACIFPMKFRAISMGVTSNDAWGTSKWFKIGTFNKFRKKKKTEQGNLNKKKLNVTINHSIGNCSQLKLRCNDAHAATNNKNKNVLLYPTKTVKYCTLRWWESEVWIYDPPIVPIVHRATCSFCQIDHPKCWS